MTRIDLGTSEFYGVKVEFEGVFMCWLLVSKFFGFDFVSAVMIQM